MHSTTLHIFTNLTEKNFEVSILFQNYITQPTVKNNQKFYYQNNIDSKITE